MRIKTGVNKPCELCGKEFWLIPAVLKRPGRGKFCSQDCKKKAMIGKSPWNKGTTGAQVAWNKGLPGLSNENHPQWKEVGYSYSAIHNWILRNMGKATICSHCESVKSVEWANISHEYHRDTSDFMSLCKKCHIKYDRESGSWGTATSKFAL